MLSLVIVKNHRQRERRRMTLHIATSPHSPCTWLLGTPLLRGSSKRLPPVAQPLMPGEPHSALHSLWSEDDWRDQESEASLTLRPLIRRSGKQTTRPDPAMADVMAHPSPKGRMKVARHCQSPFGRVPVDAAGSSSGSVMSRWRWR